MFEFSGQDFTTEYDPDDQNKSNLVMILLINFPIQQVIWYAMIFGWLKAAEILRNPFGSPMLSPWNHRKDFCLDMFHELEFEIWKASKFLENQDIIPLDDIQPPIQATFNT